MIAISVEKWSYFWRFPMYNKLIGNKHKKLFTDTLSLSSFRAWGYDVVASKLFGLRLLVCSARGLGLGLLVDRHWVFRGGCYCFWFMV